MFKVSKPWLIVIGAAIVVVLMFSVKDTGGADTGSGSGDCRVTVNADILNVRDSPSLRGEQVDTLEQGDETDAQPTVRNGFRKLDDESWAASKYLTPVDKGACK